MLTIKTVFKGIAGGIVIVSAFELLRRCSTYDQLVSAIDTCVLPAGNKLIQIAEGSVNLKVQAGSRSALDNLWRMYKNGTLKARLKALLVTDEMRKFSGGEEVDVIVTIDEEEYEKARDELTTEARGNPSARLLIFAFNGSVSSKRAHLPSGFVGHLSLSVNTPRCRQQIYTKTSPLGLKNIVKCPSLGTKQKICIFEN